MLRVLLGIFLPVWLIGGCGHPAVEEDASETVRFGVYALRAGDLLPVVEQMLTDLAELKLDNLTEEERDLIPPLARTWSRALEHELELRGDGTISWSRRLTVEDSYIQKEESVLDIVPPHVRSSLRGAWTLEGSTIIATFKFENGAPLERDQVYRFRVESPSRIACLDPWHPGSRWMQEPPLAFEFPLGE